MSGLSYGLNISKKGNGPPRRPQPSKKRTIFDDDPSDGEDEVPKGGAQEISSFADLSKPGINKTNGSKSKLDAQSKPPSLVTPSTSGTTDLSAKLSAAKHAAAAQELDPSIYNYDEIYESINHKPIKKEKKSEAPQYMQALLESAEVRKRDQLRAKEKMLAREREAEGEEFADKEKFVTGAYKAQQEEVRRLEEEERKREEEAAERARREGGGMRGFYKGLLDREDSRRKEIEEHLAKGGSEIQEAEVDKEKELAELAAKKGATVNEDGQVVDKRQLLSAGLNVAAKPSPGAKDRLKTESLKPSASMSILQGKAGVKAAQRERQSQMLEEQLAQSAKRAAEDELAEQEALKKAAKSRKTEGEVSSARERYLQRKREAEAAKAAGTAP